jgi:hypothetical protein
MNCPKCGYQQDSGSECLRCGIVFSRYHAELNQVSGSPKHSRPRKRLSPFRLFMKIARWTAITLLVVAIILILHPSKPPDIAIPPDAEQLAEEKIQRFQSATQHGATNTLELNQSELNGWLNANLALKKRPTSTADSQMPHSLDDIARTGAGKQAIDNSSIQKAQSSIRDIKIKLLENSLLAYVVFDMHGMDLSLELEGRLSVKDGYLRLDPTAGKLGSMPLMAGTLHSSADRLFNSPENKEKFKMPPEIQDVTVKHGNLLITSR